MTSPDSKFREKVVGGARRSGETERYQVRTHKAMKLKKLFEQIRMGFGQGHGCDYQPWLKVRRKNSSSKSNQVVAWMSPLGRSAHYFSKGEYKTALLLLWLGVNDLREQYPLWPISHPHPLTGALSHSSMELPWMRGLMDIASEAGIDHGVEVGTDIPYVATIDFLVTLHTAAGLKLVGISCKPFSDSSTQVKARTMERLELERRYFKEAGVRYLVSSSSLVPNLMAGQLEWWMGCSVLHNNTELYQHSNQFAAFLEEHEDVSIAEAIIEASKCFEIALEAAWQLFRYCAWHQLIDIDPTERVVTSHPIHQGGRALRATLRESIFGEEPR